MWSRKSLWFNGVWSKGYWIISTELKRNFETIKWSSQFHKLQLWSLLWVTYTKEVLGRQQSRAIHSYTRQPKMGIRWLKGTKAKNRFWLLREKQIHTYGNRVFSSPWGGHMIIIPHGPLNICISKKAFFPFSHKIKVRAKVQRKRTKMVKQQDMELTTLHKHIKNTSTCGPVFTEN